MGMPWMEQAWALNGQSEVTGEAANPEILALFREAGHAEIMSDEVPWCAAALTVVLKRAGMPAPVGFAALRAKTFEAWGSPCDLRVGAIAVLKMSRGYHCGLVAGWTDTHVMVLGGNQSDAFNTTPFRRAHLVATRWPAPPVTAAELKQKSRTVATAGKIQRDGASATALEVSRHVPAPDAAHVDQVMAKAAKAQGFAEQLEGFATFAWSRWPWFAGGLVVYFLARMAWHAGWVSWFRAEDHNAGKSLAGAPEIAPDQLAAVDEEVIDAVPARG